MDQQYWVSLLVGWLPFIALIAVWLFISRGTKGRGPWAVTIELYEAEIAERQRANALLERIVVALEKRNESESRVAPAWVSASPFSVVRL
jgi:hypothetical protein